VYSVVAPFIHGLLAFGLGMIAHKVAGFSMGGVVVLAVIVGITVVFIARYTLAKLPKVKVLDALATGGLFGAVSGSTMAAGLTVLEEQKISYEAWAGALYPFMDIPALVTAIVVANIYLNKKKAKSAVLESSVVEAGDDYPSSQREYRDQQKGSGSSRVKIWPIVKESLQGPALSAMLLGLALGIFTQPESVYKGFYDPAFRGLLSILMLVMGMEAWSCIAWWHRLFMVFLPLVLV